MTAESIIELRNMPILEQLSTTGSGGIEATFRIGMEDRYPIVWTHSYGPTVFNPDLEIAIMLFNGQFVPLKSEATLLLPLMRNGRCAADCWGCVYSNRRTKDVMVESVLPATPVDCPIFHDLVLVSTKLGEENGIIVPESKFRVNALLSGDPAFNPKALKIICDTAQDPRIVASRWSTIAARTKHNSLQTFIDAARFVQARELHHKLRFQVSFHSTNPERRKAHVGHFRGGTFGDLFTPQEIAQTFEEIYSINGAKSTLAFVVDSKSDIDPDIIAQNFSSVTTIVSLRPMIRTNGLEVIQMDDLSFARLYTKLRDQGFDVVIMPTVDGSEMDNTIAGINHTAH